MQPRSVRGSWSLFVSLLFCLPGLAAVYASLSPRFGGFFLYLLLSNGPPTVVFKASTCWMHPLVVFIPGCIALSRAGLVAMATF